MSDTLEARTLPADLAAVGVKDFFSKVYGWMSLGLVITGVVAWYSYQAFVSSVVVGGAIPGWFRQETMFVLILVELALVWGISRSIMKIPPGVAAALFTVYAALNGFTLFFIFLRYTHASIASTFFVTAGTFAGMSIYGMTTKKDLTSIGSFCYMAVWGLILASVVNLFLGSTVLYWATTYAGVLIFVGLTAYDTQKLRALYDGGFDSERGQRGLVIYGALSLYIDFIALFIYLLRILGTRRSS